MEKLEELTVQESAQGDEINLIKVKVRALVTDFYERKRGGGEERRREREREKGMRRKYEKVERETEN